MLKWNGIFLTVLSLILLTGCNEKQGDLKALFQDETIIQVQVLGDFDDTALEEVKYMIATQFHADSIIVKYSSLPDSCITKVKTTRYRADKLLRYLKTQKDEKAIKLIALTKQDISVTKYDSNGKIKTPEYKYADWGIMGLAYRSGPVCIVSSFRLKSNDKKLFMQRLRKVSMHELGHNYGNPHCPDKTCVMTDAVESITTIDGTEEQFCEVCEKKI